MTDTDEIWQRELDKGMKVVFSQSEISFWKEKGFISESDGKMFWSGAEVIENTYIGSGEKV